MSIELAIIWKTCSHKGDCMFFVANYSTAIQERMSYNEAKAQVICCFRIQIHEEDIYERNNK